MPARGLGIIIACQGPEEVRPEDVSVATSISEVACLNGVGFLQRLLVCVPRAS